MSSAESLMGVGVPAEMAKRTGFEVTSVTTTAAGQGSAGGLLVGSGNKLVRATIAIAAQAVTLPADAAPGDEIIVANVSSNAGVIFPQVGGNINGNADNATVALTAQGAAGSNWRFTKVNTTRWAGWSGADQA